ncbi:hypothetical protein THAOC_32022 [Thalassiosira oceanica]|uniref:Uncharacterized protein n=1 Tax=Thalassiosira oceanica TaxID=159749 RepID=K0R6X1_THAOC|nr:hypothetical protein THAOC_32022 [Thalassiosira oceanica]|eukprot:EJK49133.1 hypothetical protein THAOC_32022 [Thalassiosira oceanica]
MPEGPESIEAGAECFQSFKVCGSESRKEARILHSPLPIVSFTFALSMLFAAAAKPGRPAGPGLDLRRLNSKLGCPPCSQQANGVR